MHVNRRDFLRRSICAALGGASLYSALGNLRLVAAAANARRYAFSDYKALVCVFLYGGNDSFNTIVPLSGQARTDYESSRGDLALPVSGLPALTPAAGGGPANYGVHPAMTEVAGLFNAGTNIGAGTITCNYDGYDKHRTTIGAGAFIGSDVALVAPVSVGDGAIVAAGSVITENVSADDLALARGRQVRKPNWAAEFRAAKESAARSRPAKPRSDG